MRTFRQEPRYGARILAPRPCFALIAAITIILYIGAAARLIEVAGWKLLHIGDSEATADDFRLNGLKREAIDIAFLPFWYFLHDAGRKAVRDEIQPRHIVLMRIPPPDANDEYINRRGGWAKALGEIKSGFPNAVWFEREMERKEFK